MKAATIIYQHHVLVPSKRRVEHSVGRTIAELDPKWTRPYVALLDGKPVLRRDWDIYVENGRILVFIDVEALPAGPGGGSNPVRLVAMLAVVALSAGMGALVAGAIGTSTVLGMGGATWGTIASGAMMLGGSALVNAVFPAQQQMANQQSLPSASPTYNLQAQGNTARLEQPIPEQFGRMLCYPDFSSNPYQEFRGNDQYLYMLLCVGRGEYDIEVIRIEDTPISEFEDVEYVVYGPYEPVTLFPSQVVSSSEVAGQSLEYGTWSTEVVVNAAGTEANYIGFDFVADRGMFHAQDDGGLDAVTISVEAQVIEIDDDGAEIGTWTTVVSKSYTKKTVTPQRFSEKASASPGRYKARARRTNEEETGTSWAHSMVWGGLRGYLVDDGDYGDTTNVAIIMRASEQLTSVSSRKISIISTRRLPIRDGTSWSTPQPTRSIAWAAAYAAKQTGWTDDVVDLATLLQLDAVWTSRGDTCDGRFDSTVTAWEALQRILRTGRAKPFQQAGILRFWRDQQQAIPVATFGMYDIRKGSFSVDYVMPSEMTADAVSATYFDSGVWRQKRVQASLPGSSALKPAKIDFPLITDRAQAFREAIYEAGSNRYRRKLPKFQTEMKGFIPSYGDLIVIQHDMPAWGQGGVVVAWDSATLTATCSEPLTWEVGETHYVALTKRNGGLSGPYVCIQGANEHQFVLLEALEDGFEPYTGTAYERTRYHFGWGATWGQRAIVLAIIPRSEKWVEIQAVAEDDNVHTAETGAIVPTAPTSQLANYRAAPVVEGLIARSDPGDVTRMLLSWQPAPWAQYYLIQVSADGEAWTSLGRSDVANFEARAIYGAETRVRVAAVNTARGLWVTVQYGDSADYMWTGSDDDLMWTGSDDDLMWG